VASAANAWIIDVKTGTSSMGQLSQETNAITNTWAPTSVSELRQGFWTDNVPKATKPTLFTYKSSANPTIWWGTMFKGDVGGPDSTIVSFYTPSSTKAPAGLWYLYKSATLPVIGATDAQTLAGMTCMNPNGATISATTYNAATGALNVTLNAGDYFALTQIPSVPEPGSMVAMLSGLAGLVGFGIRRRK